MHRLDRRLSIYEKRKAGKNEIRNGEFRNYEFRIFTSLCAQRGTACRKFDQWQAGVPQCRGMHDTQT